MRVILAALVLGVNLVGGCGQMGPLYMPAKEPPAAGDPAAGDPAAGDPAVDAAAEPETD